MMAPGEDMALSPMSRTLAVDLLVHGAQSRSALARKMDVSAATMTRLVKPLLAAHVLQETDVLRTPGRGRSALALDVVADRSRFVGVKLTADELFAVVTDLRCAVLDSEVLPVPSRDVRDVVRAVSTAVEALKRRSELRIDAVGVTVGGLVDAGEIVADSPFLDWHGVPFRTLLSEVITGPVHLDNDVVGLTKVQHWFGHGRGHADFALLTVGAGIGYGLVVNHEMVRTGASPFSHYPVDPSGPPCPTGHRGCMTALLASGSVAAAVSEEHGRKIRFEEALDLAEAGDPAAGRVVRRAAHALGRAAAAIRATTGVERIILSGEGVHLVDVARSAVNEGYTEYEVRGVQPQALVVRPMDFLEWARGAAALAIQAEFPR